MKESKSTQKRKKTSAQIAQGKYTRHHQNNPNVGKSLSPRRLFRGLTVQYSTAPGQKYLHPERHRKIQEVSTT